MASGKTADSGDQLLHSNRAPNRVAIWPSSQELSIARHPITTCGLRKRQELTGRDGVRNIPLPVCLLLPHTRSQLRSTLESPPGPCSAALPPSSPPTSS